MEILSYLFYAVIIAIPIILTVINTIQLFRNSGRIIAASTELIGIIVGAVYLMLSLAMLQITDKMWYEEIYDIDRYPPYDISRAYQLVLIAFTGIAGWAFLRYCPPEKQPPLAAVLAFGSLYAVAAEFVIFMIQIWGCETWGFILVYPVNLIIILIKLIKEQISYRTNQPVKDGLKGIKKLLSGCCSMPVLGFIALALFIGILAMILTLFGQTPGDMIKVWTNTAEWTLSKQTPPPKVPYDGHYLCTAAANGHEKLVRPLRTGTRGGHTILVNRQLMAANAFEDLLTEHTPRFHHALRSFYDKNGFPLSRHITTKIRSDIVYLLMKPLEWIFILALYLFDAKPEDRIAVQYMGKR